jgi:hypothetical protein
MVAQDGRPEATPATNTLLAVVLFDLERDEIRFDRRRALALCLSMIFSENRYTLFRIML